MSQSEPRRCHTASLNWLRIMRNQERFCPKSWLPRPARPSGSRQDNSGNHKSHPTGWAHNASGRDAGGVGQRYAARCGSSHFIIVAWGERWRSIRCRLQTPNSACAPPRALPGCCAARAVPPMRRRFLIPVYDRFSEGFETADLKSAKTLLDALGHAQ